MYDGKRVLALIPARGGSKGIPGKNMVSVAGKPLIWHAINCAKQSKYIDEVVVSSDSRDIGEAAESYGALYIKRPEDISGDDSLVIDAVKYVVDFLQGKNNFFDILLLLEPTSPLRTVDTIDSCIEKLVSSGVDSVATFTETEIPPSRVWRISGEIPEPYIPNSNPWLPRQKHEVGYQLNGVVYGIKVDVVMLESTRSILTENCIAVQTSRKESMDIDTVDDLAYVEFLIERL